MHFATSTAAGAILCAGLASAIPYHRRQQDSLAPCANVTQAYNEFLASNYTSFVVDGELAYECLNSMPFETDLATQFAIEISKYLQFQSTIPQLLNPPPTYLSEGVDLLGGIEAIIEKAINSSYGSQYEFDNDLISLLFSANDGHLSAGLCSLSIFGFSIPHAIVSVSEDGTTIPKVYISTDAALMNNGSTDISDITQINGQNVTDYLTHFDRLQNNQDPDARWNDLFPSLAKLDSEGRDASVGAFAVNQGFWPNASTIEFTFSNGSTISSRVTATTKGFNFTDGQALFEAYCLPANSTSSNTTSTSDSDATQATPTLRPTSTAGPVGFPKPEIRDPYNFISGYYLDDEDMSDVAVLFIPTFSISGADLPSGSEALFASIAADFVNTAVADNKTKMIIDISGNPGGQIVAGFDLFKLFFPDMDAYSATRMRDHPAQSMMVQAFSALTAENPGADTDPSTQLLLGQNPFNWAEMVTPNQTDKFSSVEEFEGPYEIEGGNMTTLYANFNFTLSSNEYNPIRGYGGIPLNVTGRPFEPENILIVSDGFCQSTCTTFVNLMTSPEFGNVSSLAFGGRPIEAPMQAIGGTRGAQSAEWEYLSELVGDAYQVAQNASGTSSPVLSDGDLQLFAEIAPIPLKKFPLIINSGNLNLRNSYNPNNTETPLQFTYQPADCKLFYTYDNVFKPATSWVAAARATWGNGTCVSGSVPMGRNGSDSIPPASALPLNITTGNSGNYSGHWRW